ncbi:hypothetical protein C8R45DRAFT_1097762 [Mycena sanguinolenta]|nr:hypothetical protein C8R45DRAFT_1097762 [Mycena sanguinolenta]
MLADLLMSTFILAATSATAQLRVHSIPSSVISRRSSPFGVGASGSARRLSQLRFVSSVIDALLLNFLMGQSILHPPETPLADALAGIYATANSTSVLVGSAHAAAWVVPRPGAWNGTPSGDSATPPTVELEPTPRTTGSNWLIGTRLQDINIEQ